MFSPQVNTDELLSLIDACDTETRHKILAYWILAANGYRTAKKDLLRVIVEVALESGLDVVASYIDGSARYINQTGKMISWETWDAASFSLTKDLFQKSSAIVARIGPYGAPRKPFPPR